MRWDVIAHVGGEHIREELVVSAHAPIRLDVFVAMMREQRLVRRR